MAMKKRIYGPAIRPEPKPTPLDAKNLIKDQVLHWSQPGPNGQRAHAYVIIRAITDQTIEVAPVQPTRPETKCYDEGGADPKRDKDHVLLRYSSELFPELNKQSVRGCYAIANNDAPAKIPVQNLSIFHIVIKAESSLTNGIPGSWTTTRGGTSCNGKNARPSWIPSPRTRNPYSNRNPREPAAATSRNAPCPPCRPNKPTGQTTGRNIDQELPMPETRRGEFSSSYDPGIKDAIAWWSSAARDFPKARSSSFSNVVLSPFCRALFTALAALDTSGPSRPGTAALT